MAFLRKIFKIYLFRFISIIYLFIYMKRELSLFILVSLVNDFTGFFLILSKATLALFNLPITYQVFIHFCLDHITLHFLSFMVITKYNKTPQKLRLPLL